MRLYHHGSTPDFCWIACILAALVLFSVSSALALDEAAVVAHWPLDDGAGAEARDVGPHGFDASVAGKADWVGDEAVAAIRLNGEGQYLIAPEDLPLLTGPDGGTVMLWFRPEGSPMGGLLGRTQGNRYAGARLTLAYKPAAGDRFVQNLSDGENHDYADLFPIPRSGYWNHCALSYDGSEVRTYINGALMRQRELDFTPEMGGGPLWIGRTGLWLGGPETFRGLLSDVLVLSRALTNEEVQEYVRETGERYGYSTTRPAVQIEPRPESGRTVVSLEHGIMAGVDPDTRFSVAVYRPGEAEPLAEAVSGPSLNPRSAEAVIDLQDVSPGPLEVSAYALTPDGKPASETGTATVQWPERTGPFLAADGVRVLNNMTFELINEETVAGREHQFRNPRDGWVYLAASAEGAGTDAVSLLLDGQPIDLHRVGDYWETMRDLPKGDYRVQLTDADGPRTLIVRSVGELFHDIYGLGGPVERAAGIKGVNDWGFLREHVLDHVNSVVAHTRVFTEAEYEDQLQWWDDRGGKWSQWFHEPNEDILEHLRSMPGLSHPLGDGAWIDEFGTRHRPVFGEWREAMEALCASPKTADRTLYLYFMGLNSAMGGLVRAAADTDNRVGIEWYMRTHETKRAMEEASQPHVQRAWKQWFDEVSGDNDDCRAVALAIASHAGAGWDMYPHVDFRAFYDRQFQFVANDPSFFGVRGIQGWWSTRADEEMIRLNAQLMRHYFIEGNTERYLSDPYILTHLKNPDFTDGTEGWNLRPAEPGSIDARTAPLFGQLQGRAVTYYHAPAPEDLGDSVLWTKRSAEAPNRFSQIVRDLEPGRTYSLRWFTGDYQDLVEGRSDDTPHAISVAIERAEMLTDPELSYDYVLPSIPGWSGRKLGPFDRDNSYYYSGYHRVFRAQGTTARLTFSDWESVDAPNGPERQELIWNFICVRPYLKAK